MTGHPKGDAVAVSPVPGAPAGAQPRGSHADRRAATRRRLLDATIESLVELGYARTTTIEVQARAGVSRGALLHHFASRADLFMAAVDHLFAVRYAALHEESLRLGHSADQLDTAIEIMWGALQSPSTIAAIELWTASRTDPELAEALRRHEPALAAQLSRIFQALMGPRLTAHPAFPAYQATIMEAMAGTALAQHVRDPHVVAVEVEHWKTLGRLLFGPTSAAAHAAG
jgi:AcrR family transcriptional regulator